MFNIQCPISNVQCPSGAPVWRQHDGWVLIRLNGENTCQPLAIQASKAPKNVLTPGRRTTWTLDIGHWLLDIEHSTFSMFAA
ncbi:MAG: hypothetical protein J0M29_17735 [Chitinophagales bacterium]|nr:hypothetical protein [Chitinophagales bacterium]